MHILVTCSFDDFLNKSKLYIRMMFIPIRLCIGSI